MGNERERERLQTGKERDPRNIANGEGRRNGGISGEGEKVKMDYVTCLGQEQAILCPRVPAETSLHSVGCAHTNTHTHTQTSTSSLMPQRLVTLTSSVLQLAPAILHHL